MAFSMGVTARVFDAVFQSSKVGDFTDMELIPPMSDAGSVAGALRPHLEGGQLKLAFEVGMVQ